MAAICLGLDLKSMIAIRYKYCFSFAHMLLAEKFSFNLRFLFL